MVIVSLVIKLLIFIVINDIFEIRYLIVVFGNIVCDRVLLIKFICFNNKKIFRGVELSDKVK